MMPTVTRWQPVRIITEFKSTTNIHRQHWTKQEVEHNTNMELDYMTQESLTHEPRTHNMPLHCTTHRGGTASCSASSRPMLSVLVHNVSILFPKNYTGQCLICKRSKWGILTAFREQNELNLWWLCTAVRLREKQINHVCLLVYCRTASGFIFQFVFKNTPIRMFMCTCSAALALCIRVYVCALKCVKLTPAGKRLCSGEKVHSTWSQHSTDNTQIGGEHLKDTNTQWANTGPVRPAG